MEYDIRLESAEWKYLPKWIGSEGCHMDMKNPSLCSTQLHIFFSHEYRFISNPMYFTNHCTGGPKCTFSSILCIRFTWIYTSDLKNVNKSISASANFHRFSFYAWLPSWHHRSFAIPVSLIWMSLMDSDQYLEPGVSHNDTKNPFLGFSSPLQK